MRITLILLALLISNFATSEIKIQVSLKYNTLTINNSHSSYQVEGVIEFEEVDCYSGNASKKLESIHFAKRYSRHQYLFLTRENEVYGIRDNGIIEKESGEEWKDLADFKINLEVCT